METKPFKQGWMGGFIGSHPLIFIFGVLVPTILSWFFTFAVYQYLGGGDIAGAFVGAIVAGIVYWSVLLPAAYIVG